MPKFINKIAFIVILLFYMCLYMATKYVPECYEDCEKRRQIDASLSVGRNYFYGTYRCTNTAVSDTLCVYVKDTTGINWNLFADTVCSVATSYGLIRQKVFIIKQGSIFPLDTVARKQCP